MRQVLQPISGGPVEVAEVPRPTAGPTEVLVRTVASVISPGTERAVTALAQASLLAKARARPDLVRQVVRKARTEGAGRHRADRPRPPRRGPAAGLLGRRRGASRSARPSTGIRAGQLVATGGAGKANHAEFQAVPGPAVRRQSPTACRPATPRSPPWPPSRCTACGWPRSGPAPRSSSSGSAWSVSSPPGWPWPRGCDVAGHRPGGARADRRCRQSGVLALDERGTATTEQVLAWSRGRGRGCRAGLRRRPVVRPPCCGPRRCAGTGLQLSWSAMSACSCAARRSTSGSSRCVSPAPTARAGTSRRMRHGAWTTRPGRCAGPRAGTSRRCSTCWPRAGCRWPTWSPTRYDIGEAAAAYELIEKTIRSIPGDPLSYPATAAADDARWYCDRARP